MREKNLRVVKRSISEDNFKMSLQPGWGKRGQWSTGLDNWTVLEAILGDDNGNGSLKRSVESHKQRYREAKKRNIISRVGREWHRESGWHYSFLQPETHVLSVLHKTKTKDKTQQNWQILGPRLLHLPPRQQAHIEPSKPISSKNFEFPWKNNKNLKNVNAVGKNNGAVIPLLDFYTRETCSYKILFISVLSSSIGNST